MLYLDDIQHTHPELLQKFISLCDGQRRIEGVYKGKTRTYDLRGKKFCVVMAGNPYTESGDKFQIPDMLANRADTYNLGDILDGREEVFALSYVENSLTSNPVLAPLGTRDQADVYKLAAMANGEDVATSDLSYGYSAAELQEMVGVLKKLFTARDVLLKVNAQYIESASQQDAFRTEPPFKLQGSYRNMNKLAEKIVSVMSDDEVERLIDDHYLGESQTLTTGAEQNLLKLAELRGRMSDEQRARWETIKREFVRLASQGGADTDPVTRLTGTLGGLGRELEGIRDTLMSAVDRSAEHAKARAAAEEVSRQAEPAALDPAPFVAAMRPPLAELTAALARMAQPQIEVNVDRPEPTVVNGEPIANATLAQQVEVIRDTLLPLVNSSQETLADAQEMHDHIIQLLDLVRRMDEKLREKYELGDTAS